MRKWVAHNKTVPNEVLRVLIRDPDSAVRLPVAMKNKLPEDLFFLLAQDEDDGGRQRSSCNKNTPGSILQCSYGMRIGWSHNPLVLD